MDAPLSVSQLRVGLLLAIALLRPTAGWLPGGGSCERVHGEGSQESDVYSLFKKGEEVVGRYTSVEGWSLRAFIGL